MLHNINFSSLLIKYTDIMVPQKKKLQTSPRDVEARKETRQNVEAVVAIRPNGQRQNLGSTHHEFRQFPAKGSHS